MRGLVLKTRIVVSKRAEKQLEKVPKHIKESFNSWMGIVQYMGIREARKFPGLHDKPLHGNRFGQRSVRLNRAYRAIYIETTQEIEILIIEVNKHAY